MGDWPRNMALSGAQHWGVNASQPFVLVMETGQPETTVIWSRSGEDDCSDRVAVRRVVVVVVVGM